MASISMERRRPKGRSKKGVTTMALVLLIAFFVVLPLALLGFEIGRYMLMQEELHSVADASALAGTAAMASSPSGYTYTQLEQLAMQVAAQTFQQNSILGNSFSASTVSANYNPQPPQPQNPTQDHAILNIILLDQNGNQVAVGTPAAQIQVQAYYAERPVFTSKILPVGNLMTAVAFSNGGLPQMDVMMCFDVSGSMDDQTPVTLVRRYWDPVQNKVVYAQPASASGVLYNVCGPPITGTSLNCLPPENLSFASYPGASGNTHPFTWSESPYPGSNTMHGLHSLIDPPNGYVAGSMPTPEQGLPPGNFNPTNPGNGGSFVYNGCDPNSDATGWTDMIVNMSNQGAFQLSNPYVCAEASRGNLESAAAFQRSQGGNTTNAQLGGAPVSPGYYAAYWNQVAQLVNPMYQARQAATGFFDLINVSANAHFGFETFADTAGTSATGTWSGTNKNEDSNYAVGGTGSFPLPLISLSQGATNYSAVTQAINGNGSNILPLTATGQTDIADALHECITELSNPALVRPNAKKAIVLFTDGVPNQPGGTTAAGTAAALAEASTANTRGIPIYCIGLSQNAAIRPQEDALLGDGQNGTGHGIAYISGHNAVYISVQNASQLTQAFQTIARSLVVLQ